MTTTMRRAATKVRDVMTSPVVTTTPTTPFPDLVDLMLRHEVSGLPVTDDDGRLVGIVTEADLVAKEAYAGRRRRALGLLADLLAGNRTQWVAKAQGHTAADVMTTGVRYVHANDPLRLAARTMVEAHVKRLPVLDSGRVVGIVSRADVMHLMHRSDEEIHRDLMRLFADPLRAPESHSVSLQVADGVVTLDGSVRYPFDLAMMTNLAWQVSGVVDVRSNLLAREPSPRISY